VVKLKQKVEEHKDYKLGTPLRTIRLASRKPQPGEKALTAGWGITGYNEDLSKELRSLELTVTETDDLWVYTDPYDEEGRITDPCKGDSGGPLAMKRGGEWELVGVLKGEGYNCRRNEFNGDGLWSNVASQRNWILRQLQPQGSRGPGDIHLEGWSGQLGTATTKGNVYVGKSPVCDDGWDDAEAIVTCRMLGFSNGIAETGSAYGNAKKEEQYWRSYLECRGDEESLLDCPGKDNPSCARGEVAGVVCGGRYSKPSTAVTTTVQPCSTTQLPRSGRIGGGAVLSASIQCIISGAGLKINSGGLGGRTSCKPPFCLARSGQCCLLRQFRGRPRCPKKCQ